MTQSDLQKQVNAISWGHSIDLGNGIVTPGICDTGFIMSYLHLPESFEGKRILDIGACDGFYSFLAEKRGATDVIAIDTWDKEEVRPVGHPRSSREGFDLVCSALHSKVRGIQMNVYDICPELLGQFDIVLMLGVYYHLKHPLLALEKVYNICRRTPPGLLILEGHLDLLSIPRPVCAFYDSDQLAGDPTNWNGPNILCVQAWLKTVGFKDIQFVGGNGLDHLHPPATIQGARGAFHARREGE